MWPSNSLSRFGKINIDAIQNRYILSYGKYSKAAT